MPIIFVLKTEKEREMYFLIKEGYFPLEGIDLLKNRLSNHIKFNDEWTRKELMVIAEDTIEEYGCTLVPFTAFSIRY